jgi:SAM-dependent methyltransferase
VIFLSRPEIETWRQAGEEALANRVGPGRPTYTGRANLEPMFDYFIGTLLAAHGATAQGKEWLLAGAQHEAGMFSNTFVSAFLERTAGRFIMPAKAFEDPRPFVHFASVPLMVRARELFLEHASHSLPAFRRPFRILDIGTGNGALLANLLQRLRAHGKVNDMAEVLLVDASPAMTDLAAKTVAEALPGAPVRPLTARIEEAAGRLEGRYDVALMSLAYHHLPWEQKKAHLERLKAHVDHVLVFELDANNDTPELHSPELACSVYQSYGRIIDFVFAHDAPVAVAQACVDFFLMTEQISLLTQPRGRRTEYHMLRGQWHELFRGTLGTDFACAAESTCFADESLDLFFMHYGR